MVGMRRPNHPKLGLNRHPVGKNCVQLCVWALLSGGLPGGQVPSELRFSRSSPRSGNFSVSDRGTQSGPEWAHTGPTDTIWGQKGVKTKQTGSPDIAKVDYVRGQRQWTPLAPVSEVLGRVLGFWGPSWALGLGPKRAQLGPTDAVLGQNPVKT